MAQFKGTPGPWEVENQEFVVKGEKTIAAVGGFIMNDDDRANSKLIGAAPELLEALRQLRNLVQDCYHGDKDAQYWNDEHHPMYLAKVALSKVLGQ